MEMDFERAAEYWEKKDADAKQMERDALFAEMEKFIGAHNTCALATGCGDFVRCTPIEYSYREGKFWMLSEGGQKFRALEKNRNVCLAIFDSYGGFGNLGGMQITGTAELVEPWSAEYRNHLAAKKIPEEALRGLAHPMYLLRVTPARIDFLCSALRQQGFDPRQHLTF
jgi:Predicted flavin-nucleotide-binding protein